jgi:hypothetical protein
MAKAKEPYVSAKFKVWAIFTTDSGQIVFDDVVAVSASFALNTIPTASLVVAVGTNAITNEPATIHAAQARIKPRDRVVVKLRVTHGAGDDTKFPNGTYTIFDGFFIGIGYQRSHNQANFVINLTHWLDDLNNSSAVNGNWFPSVPFDYAQSAVYDKIAATGTGAGAAAYNPNPTVADDFAQPAYVQDDLWELVIKKLFLRLAGYPGGLVAESSKTASSNAAALAALDRMPGDGIAYYKKLAFKLSAIGAPNLADSFGKYFTKTIGTSFAQNTFWAKLVAEYAAQFFFSISPAVSWALPIPFCAGLRWADGGKIIKADEYNYANFNANTPQLIRSVEVAYAATEMNGLPTPPPNDKDPDPPRGFFYPGGIYPPVEPDRYGRKQPDRGLRLFKMPPNWAENIDGSTLLGLAATTDAAATTSGASNKDDGTKRPGGVTSAPAAADEVTKSVHLFAQHWYVTEVLQQRYGELSGALRFDIAPGSIVKIMTPARDTALNNPTADPDEEHVVASVISVSYVINAERATAGTSFSIAHTKIKSELAPDSIYAVSTPPLYSEAWHGGPLAVMDTAPAGVGGTNVGGIDTTTIV